MKRLYIKPVTEIISVEVTYSLTAGSNYKEDGSVVAASGEETDDEGDYINLGKRNYWDEEEKTWSAWK